MRFRRKELKAKPYEPNMSGYRIRIVDNESGPYRYSGTVQVRSMSSWINTHYEFAHEYDEVRAALCEHLNGIRESKIAESRAEIILPGEC